MSHDSSRDSSTCVAVCCSVLQSVQARMKARAGVSLAGCMTLVMTRLYVRHVLQSVVVCCSLLQCAAPHRCCSVLQRAAVNRRVLQRERKRGRHEYLLRVV